ncbi:MAG TPA: hypothetical protein VLA14_04895 [Polyangia bacterium]|nr:hypothetical protein [Polyangia bacterium]
MRNINFRICALPASLLAMTMVANLGCSTGTGSGAGTAGTSGTAGATTGSAGATGGTAGATGSAGATGGTAGATSGAAGTVGGTAGTTGGTAGTTVGGTAGAGLPTTGVCAGTGTRALTIAQGKVDDFEADPILPGWSSFNDVQPTMNAFQIMREAGGADGTGFAGHYMGTGAKTPVMGGFGVGTIYNMAIDTMAMIYCVDITAFDGVTFWAKAGATASANAKVGVNFVIPSTNQAPQGDCPTTSTTCFNHPQKSITLTTDWQQYSVAFSAAVGGTGAKVGSVLQELGWLSPDSTWDFWIDEIQLYKGTPPTTPVGGNSTSM